MLSYTFADGSGASSRVTFQIGKLDESAGSDGEPVRLTITHDEFPVGSEVIEKVSNGWPGIMAGLKTLLETGHPLGITSGCKG